MLAVQMRLSTNPPLTSGLPALGLSVLVLLGQQQCPPHPTSQAEGVKRQGSVFLLILP